jgi:hypothetical protein
VRVVAWLVANVPPYACLSGHIRAFARGWLGDSAFPSVLCLTGFPAEDWSPPLTQPHILMVLSCPCGLDLVVGVTSKSTASHFYLQHRIQSHFHIHVHLHIRLRIPVNALLHAHPGLDFGFRPRLLLPIHLHYFLSVKQLSKFIIFFLFMFAFIFCLILFFVSLRPRQHSTS